MPTSTGSSPPRRPSMSLNVARLQAERRREVATGIRLYKRLSPKVEVGCRVIEATNLLNTIRTRGNFAQVATFRRLMTETRLPYIETRLPYILALNCRCHSSACEYIQPTSGDGLRCRCIEMGGLCREAYVYGQAGSILYFAPGARRD